MFMPIVLGLIVIGLLCAFWYDRRHQGTRLEGSAGRPRDMRAEQARAEVIYHASRNDIQGR